MGAGSGGADVPVSEDLPDVRIENAEPAEVDRANRIPIWNTFPVFAGLLVLQGLERWIRRVLRLLTISLTGPTGCWKPSAHRDASPR